jgi:prepilin-type N-terminal cleavage/methylation domain-containing protein
MRYRTRSRTAHRQRGMSLIELMIALAVLTIGLTSLLGLIVTAIANDGKAKVDTGATLVSQMMIETLSAQTNPNNSFTIKDCTSTTTVVWTLLGVPADAPGNGAQLNATTGAIDFSGQTYAAAPASYKMTYRSCGANGTWTDYDVRWNVTRITDYSRQITVSARALTNANAASVAKMYTAPVTLRTIALTN